MSSKTFFFPVHRYSWSKVKVSQVNYYLSTVPKYLGLKQLFDWSATKEVVVNLFSNWLIVFWNIQTKTEQNLHWKMRLWRQTILTLKIGYLPIVSGLFPRFEVNLKNIIQNAPLLFSNDVAEARFEMSIKDSHSSTVPGLNLRGFRKKNDIFTIHI